MEVGTKLGSRTPKTANEWNAAARLAAWGKGRYKKQWGGNAVNQLFINGKSHTSFDFCQVLRCFMMQREVVSPRVAGQQHLAS